MVYSSSFLTSHSQYNWGKVRTPISTHKNNTQRRRSPSPLHAYAKLPPPDNNNNNNKLNSNETNHERKKKKRARQPGLFEVEDISPPRRSLGIHALPTNTHNGDEIAVEGESYVVQSVVFQYRLVRGRYRTDHRRLEVHSTGRFLYNKFLENVYNMDSTTNKNDI